MQSSVLRSEYSPTTSPSNTESESSPFILPEDGVLLANAYDLVEDIGFLREDDVKLAIHLSQLLHPELVGQLQYISVSPIEVTKQQLLLLATMNGGEVPVRCAEVISLHLAKNQTIVDRVPLVAPAPPPHPHSAFTAAATTAATAAMRGEILTPTSETLQDVQPGPSPEEYALVEQLCKNYEPLKEAMVKRGLDPRGIVADCWCLTGPPPTERMAWASLYYSEPEVDDLPYARPIDGISMRISLTKKAVVEFNDDVFDLFPIPDSFDAKSHFYPTDKQRKDLKPIVITQPAGPTFCITHGNHVYWQKWSMHVGFNSREGCTLHGICYDGRPILHKFSMCEMVVPYGDPRPPHCWKNAFDAGEDGLGRNANSLVLGCDCLGHIHYFDAFMVTDAGNVRTIKNAICMHEEDAGIAWKHTDWRTEIPVVARNRKLVISFICTIANYEYGFYYHFYLDGAIEVDVKLTGVLSTGALTVEEQQTPGGRKYGVSLGSTLYAPVHQHFFTARMDFAIDGVKNSISEWNVVVEPEGEENPYYNAFYYTSQVLPTELAAKRDGCSDTARFWQVLNSSAFNSIGSNTSYKLAPKTIVKPYANLQKALCLKRAQFLQHQLWVTPFRANENFPGGDFPNQCMTVEGLPKWTLQDRSVENEDIVVWHNFGVTHCPRPEEWPIMPVEHCGFKLVPFGFFDHSPSMDVPTKALESTHANAEKRNSGSGGCCGASATGVMSRL